MIFHDSVSHLKEYDSLKSDNMNDVLSKQYVVLVKS